MPTCFCKHRTVINATLLSPQRPGQLRSSWGAAQDRWRAKKDAPFTHIGNPNVTEAVPRANLSRDGSNLRSRRRGDRRSEYSGPSANRPIGRASGPGANPVHSRHAPAQFAAPPQARSPSCCAKPGPPAPRPRRLDRGRLQGSTRASCLRRDLTQASFGDRR